MPLDLTNAVAVAGGISHSLALRRDGTVLAWGDDTFGQTNVPAALANVVAIACGTYHSLALLTNGTVVCFGDNSLGQCNVPSGISNVVGVAGSGKTSYAVLADGAVVGWGATPHLPIGVANAVTFTSPANGSLGFAAVNINGATFRYGSVVNGAPSYNFVVVAGGAGAGLTVDGRIQVLNGSQMYVDSGVTNAVTVDSGVYPQRFLAILADGTLYNGPAGLSNLVAVSSGTWHSLAVVGDAGPPVFASRPMNLSINYGRTARFYQPASGAWPISYQWQLNGVDLPGATRQILAVTNVQPADLGSYSVTASNAFGTVTSPAVTLSSLPIFGQDWTPNLTHPLAVAATDFGQGLALKQDGSVIAWGANDAGQSSVPSNLPPTTAISAHSPGAYQQSHSLAVTAAGDVYSWGKNSFTNKASWLSNVVAVSAGENFDRALLKDGTDAQWSTIIPGPHGLSSPFSNRVAVAADKNPSAGYASLMADGSIIGGPYGASSASSIVAIAGGAGFLLGLKSDGTVTGWGNNSSGQLNPPPGLNNVVAIAAGDYGTSYSLALKDDGSVVAWGVVPRDVSNLVASVHNGVFVDGAIALEGFGLPRIPTPILDRFGPPGSSIFFYALATGERPLHYQWQHNGLDLPGQTRNALALTNLSLTDAGAYTLVVTNAQGQITTPSANLTVFDYASALDNSNIVFTSFGAAPWFTETNTTYTGSSALQSGPANPNSSSTLRGTVTGPGTLSFWWKGSGPTVDWSTFNVNGAQVAQIVGSTAWQQVTAYLGAGPQVLDWTFTRYSFQAAGVEACWLDGVTFTPGVTAPFITLQPVSISQAPGADAIFTAFAKGTPPLSYQWQYERQGLPGTTAATLVVTNVQSDSVGSYSALITNVAGSVTTTNAALVLGSVAEWGTASIPAYITNATALAGGLYHAVALQPDGTVLAWGNNNSGQTVVPPGITNVSYVGAGGWFSMAVQSPNGTVSAWGDNSSGQCSVPPGLSNVLTVAGGFYHALALKEDGKVVAWGANGAGQTNAPADLTNAVQIAANGSHSIVLRADGTVSAWGENHYGETNVPAGLHDVVSIRTGFNHSLALISDGSLVFWGDTNANYGLGNFPAGLTNPAAIAAGGEYNLALNPDRTMTWWGFDRGGDARVPAGLTNVSYVTAGGYLSLALVGGDAPLNVQSVRNPMVTNGSFTVAVSTKRGRVYRLEYKQSLQDMNWVSLALTAGNGREITLSDPETVKGQRFYRIRGW